MDLSNAFEVDAPAARTWDLLMDIPRVVPCMPGAELVEVLGEDRWKVAMKMKLGPMAMVFDVDVARREADRESRIVTLDVRAREQRGRGQAKATISSGLEPLGAERTRVEVKTALSLSGRIGQFGRGAVQDVAAELTERFTANLEQAAAGSGAAAAGEAAPVAAAAGGVSVLPIMLGAFRRLLARIFGRRPEQPSR